MSFRQVRSRGLTDPRPHRHVNGLAILAGSSVLGLAGVIAGTAVPAEAGISVSLSANPTFLLTVRQPP
jgi:hypothetical protein